jgi:hypothetical protein
MARAELASTGADEGNRTPSLERPAAMVGQRGDGEIRAAIDPGTNRSTS